jgi:hypothetical protein
MAVPLELGDCILSPGNTGFCNCADIAFNRLAVAAITVHAKNAPAFAPSSACEINPARRECSGFAQFNAYRSRQIILRGIGSFGCSIRH